jgi:hypothetical protein
VEEICYYNILNLYLIQKNMLLYDQVFHV